MRFYSLVRHPLTMPRHLDWLMLLLIGKSLPPAYLTPRLQRHVFSGR